MSAQQTQLLVQTFLLAESKLAPLSPGLSTGPPETEFSVFLEKISAQRSSSTSGDANLSFLSFKHVKQERVFKISNKSSALTQKKEAVSQPDEAQKLQPRESSVMERSTDSVKVKDSPAPVRVENDVYQTAGRGEAKSTSPDSAGENGVTGKSVQPSDGAISGKGSVSLPDDAVQPSQNAFVDEAQDAAETVATRVEFLLVQFMILLHGNAPADDGAQTVQGVDAETAPVAPAQNNLLFANADGVQTDASLLVSVDGNESLSLSLASQLKELQNAAQEFQQTLDLNLKRLQGAHLKAGGTGTFKDDGLSIKLMELLNELQGVVDELTLFVPQTFTDEGAEKLKELLQFAEQVKLLVQKVSAEAGRELKLKLARETDSEMNAPDAVQAGESAEMQDPPQKMQEPALQTDAAGTKTAEFTEAAQTESVESGETQSVSSGASQMDAVFEDTEQNAVVSAVESQTAELPDESSMQTHLTRFVDDAMQKAAQTLEKASGGALSPAQKTSALTALAALSQKSEAGALFTPIFAMSFKELLNVPKAFVEEVQNILQLKDFSVAGVQLLQDSLVTAVLSAEKLSLALSDFGKGAQDGNGAALSSTVKETGTEFKLNLPPALSQVQTVLQNNTVSDIRAPVMETRAVEENVMKFTQTLVKSGQLLLSAGTADMRIRLKPEHLGDLRLRIMMEEGILSATFTAQSHQVKEILESHLSLLKQTLKEQGIHVEKFVVTTGNPGDYAQAQHNAANQALERQTAKPAGAFAGDGKDDEEKNGRLQPAQAARMKMSQVDYLV